MELIDTHCHLTFKPLDEDVEAVLKRSKAAGVTGWISVGTDIEDSRKAIELAEKFDNLYAAVAIHPHEAKTVTAEAIAQLKQLAQHPEVVAVGETGLDFHYYHSPADEQRRVFAKHLEIAEQLNQPVIIHSREAFEQTVELLERYGKAVEKVVFHCFSGSAQQAEIILNKGWYISFTGVVTFKNAARTRQAAGAVPLDRLMLETDCPYMSPEPVRKQKVNEPAFLVHTANFLAELKKISPDELAKKTAAVSKNFFNLPLEQ